MLKNSIPVLLKKGSCLHTTCSFNGQPGNVLRKIMGATKKKKFYAADENPVLPCTSTVFGKSSIETKISGNPRRSNVLNKLFMRHVTDIMATGQYSKEILGFGIEVNKVKVTSDYKCLRVYWIAKESEKEDQIENLLKKNAGHLRHELSTLKLMGHIPNIVFVKDKNYCKISEVQERLKRADFGDDYVQPDLADQFKSEFQILTSLDTTVKAKLERLELESQHDTLSSDDLSEIPPMPQNVLGLNHADILKRVKNGMSVSKAAHRSTDTNEWAQWSEFKTTQPVNQDPVTFANHQEQRKAFRAFLLQRQIMKMKENRMQKNWTADREYLEEELRDRQLRSIQNTTEDDDEDFILEEVEVADAIDKINQLSYNKNN